MSSTSALQAKFFVTRPNGNIVPLIAMDELPTTVLIRDVPRNLELHKTVNMTNVGQYDTRHLFHEVSFTGIRGFNPPPISNPPVPSQPAQSSAIVHQLNGLTMDQGYPAPPRTYSLEEQGQGQDLSFIPAAAQGSATPLRELHANSRLPDKPIPGVKKFCTKWLHSGECAFVQQGCRYLHVMPQDKQGLHAVGLKDWPEWYREEYHCGSILAVPGSGAAMPRKQKLREIDESKDWRAKQG
jgi:hypothetical protein